MAPVTDSFEGGPGGSLLPLASSHGRPERSEASDRATACVTLAQAGTVAIGAQAPRHGADKMAPRHRRGNGHLDVRMDSDTREAVEDRAAHLGLTSSAWVRLLIRDALDARRLSEFDAAVAEVRRLVESQAQPSADARELARQIRPLAVNVNDLDRRARTGQAVTVPTAEVAELAALLGHVRELLGDRLASS